MSTTIRLQHSSLLVFTTPEQKRQDAKRVFSTGAPIITGTEAGAGRGKATEDALRHSAKQWNYKIWLPGPQDAWVAIKESLMDKGKFKDEGLIDVIPGSGRGDDPNGRYTAKGLPWVTFDCTQWKGEVSVGAGHWLTKGRTPGQTPPGQHNHYQWNTRMAKTVGAWAEDKGQGSGVVFYGADTNINDKPDDVFRGRPLTTCWDEIGKHPITLGKSTMDVIATYDKDKRVKCLSARVHKDHDLFLHADHFTISAVYRIAA